MVKAKCFHSKIRNKVKMFSLTIQHCTEVLTSKVRKEKKGIWIREKKVYRLERENKYTDWKESIQIYNHRSQDSCRKTQRTYKENPS